MGLHIDIVIGLWRRRIASFTRLSICSVALEEVLLMILDSGGAGVVPA